MEAIFRGYGYNIGEAGPGVGVALDGDVALYLFRRGKVASVTGHHWHKDSPYLRKVLSSRGRLP